MAGWVSLNYVLSLLGLPRLDNLDLPPTKPVCLMIYLAFRGDWVSREELAAFFCPEDEEANARRRLRVLLNRARALPWAEGLEVEHARLRWAPPTDVQAFRQAIGRGDWAEAVRLHQAPLLEGFRVVEVPGFEAWLELERDSLLTVWRDAALRQSQRLRQEGCHQQAAQLLLDLLRYNPLAEDLVAAYLEQAYLAGQRDLALKVYRDFAHCLERELGLEPLQSTKRLAEQIARAQALTPEAHPTQVSLPLSLTRPPRLVGRDREQRIVRSQSWSLVLVAGEPGVGKTRFLQEVFPQAEVLQCHEGLENLPYYPIIEYLEPRLDRLRNLGVYLEEVARLIPELSPKPVTELGDPQTAKLRLMEGLARAFEQEPHPLIFDDLQWADAATLELFLLLVTRGKRRVAGAYRLGEVTPALARTLTALRSGQKVLEVQLRPLSLEALQQLLGDLMGQGMGPPLFSHWLYKQSGGNVFFVLEVLRTLFERGTLREEGGVWFTPLDELTQDYSELEVPSRVGELVQRRMTSFREVSQRILQAASVMREGFGVGLLSKVAGFSEMAVMRALEEAEQGGLLKDSRFVHDLVRQSIYTAISKARREVLHRRCAEVLDGEADPMVVAEHWWCGGEPGEAVARWRAAAQSYSQRGMFTEALVVWERVLAVQDLPEVRLKQAEGLLSLGRYPECRAVLERLLGQMPGTSLEAPALSLLVHLLIREGHLQEALQTSEQLLQCTREAATDFRLRAVLAYANVAALMGLQTQALPMLEAFQAELGSQPPSGLLASFYSNTGWLLCGLERFEEALPLYHRALATARAAANRYWQVWASANLLYCCLELARPEQVLADTEACLQLGVYDGTEVLRINLGKAYLDLGRLQEAILMFEAVWATSQDPTHRCMALGYLADLYARVNRSEEMREALEQSLELAHRTEAGRGRVRALIAALKHGSEAQVAEALAWLPDVHRKMVPAYVWRELEEALGAWRARSGK